MYSQEGSNQFDERTKHHMIISHCEAKEYYDKLLIKYDVMNDIYKHITQPLYEGKEFKSNVRDDGTYDIYSMSLKTTITNTLSEYIWTNLLTVTHTNYDNKNLPVQSICCKLTYTHTDN